MQINEYLDQFMTTGRTGNYWFVRTDNGFNFDAFTNNNFIGIGWNEITVHNIQNLSKEEIKRKISRTEGLKRDGTLKINLNTPEGKSKATAIYNKLIRFKNLKKGDIIICPSKKGSRLAFGVISDNILQSNAEPQDLCEYYKRRNVNWLSIKNFGNLDPMFYQIKTTRHAISDVKKYHPYIDKVINTVFIKNNFGHYIVDIKTQNSINTETLLAFIKSTNDLLSIINEKLLFGENIDDSSIKLNLQSPGTIEYIIAGGKTILIYAALMSQISCGIEDAEANNPANIPNETPVEQLVYKVMTENTEIVNDITKAMTELEVDGNKINSYK